MNICVFASAAPAADCYRLPAVAFGRKLAEEGHTLVFGGGATGLMGACAQGAFENGGRMIGVAPKFFDVPGVLYQNCTELVYPETMRERKAYMEQLADCFVAFPGGIGTFEELLEILTLKQLGRHQKPILLYNLCGYYAPLLKLLAHANEQGFFQNDLADLCTVCNTEAQLWSALHGEAQ